MPDVNQGPSEGSTAPALPVNVARPDWQCPFCENRYGDDYDAACECVAAGPAPDVPSDVVVLGLSSSTYGQKPFFGVAVPSKVAAVRSDGRVVAHRRDVHVGDVLVDSDRLAATDSSRGLVVLTDTRPRERYVSDSYLSNVLEAFGVSQKHSMSYVAPGADGLRPVYVVDSYGFPDRVNKWCAPLGELRDVTAMLVGFLDDLAEMDPEKIVDRWLRTDRRQQSSSRSSLFSATRFEVLEAVVAAHGAPNSQLGTRWLTDHAEEVASWTASALVEWAGGGDVTVPAPVLMVAESLPNKPGKRRVALMEPLGCDNYANALRAVTDRIAADAPVCPVPGLDDVVSEFTAAAAASRKEGL